MRAKLKFVARFGYGDALPTDEVQDGPFRVFGSNGPYASFTRSNTGAPAIVVGRKGSYGKVNWTSEPCFASDTTFFIDSSTSQHELRWVYWLLQTLGLDEGTDEAAVPGLNRETAYSKDVAVPPPSQQRAIADYLDRETARLDALVAAKERVLGLLAEKRRALITRAVTRGLDPRTPLRDSGIPWLGEIPAHWELKRLKHVGRSIIGLTFDPADTVTDGSGVLVLRASNVRDQQIVLDDNLFVLMDIPETLRTRKGDILICSRSGSRALIGKNALIDEASIGLTFGAFMTVFRSSHNDYLFYIFNSPLFDYQAGAFSTSTINQLTVETLNGMEVPLPPQFEQKAIVASLRDRTSQLDQLTEATERTIGLLKERRGALIAAAVTGQIDVGSAA